MTKHRIECSKVNSAVNSIENSTANKVKCWLDKTLNPDKPNRDQRQGDKGLRMKAGIRSRLWFVLALPFLLPLSGCVDTTAVSEFAAVSQVASEKFPVLAEDLGASCQRTSRYQSLRQAKYDIGTIQEVSKQNCQQYDPLQKDLIAANEVLVEYMEALGKLAADDVVVYDKNLDQLAANLEATGRFEQAQVNAVNGLVKFLSRAAADGYRRRKLAQGIGSANRDVQILTTALRTIVGEDYTQLLKNEEAAMKNFYLGSIKDSQDYSSALLAQLTKTDPEWKGKTLPQYAAPLLVLQMQWEEDHEDLQDKLAGAKAYVGLLKKISAGHQELYNNRDSLGSKRVKAMVLGYAKEIEPLAKDLRDAF